MKRIYHTSNRPVGYTVVLCHMICSQAPKSFDFQTRGARETNHPVRPFLNFQRSEFVLITHVNSELLKPDIRNDV